MPLRNMGDLLTAARAGRFAVGAFECWDSLNIRGIAEAARLCRAPVIFQATTTEFNLMGGPEALASMVKFYVEKCGIEAALHLDHGKSLQEVEACLKSGFTSVMLDASTQPFEENLKLTAEAVRMARAYQAGSEAELGHVGGGGDGGDIMAESALTDPEEAEEFVRRTGVDSLAVAIGTVHGDYRGKPELRLDRLGEIARRVEVPLVLHGGSGTPPELLRAAIKLGIAKINICTDLNRAFLAGVEYARGHRALSVPGDFYLPAVEEVTKKAGEMIRLFKEVTA